MLITDKYATKELHKGHKMFCKTGFFSFYCLMRKPKCTNLFLYKSHCWACRTPIPYKPIYRRENLGRNNGLQKVPRHWHATGTNSPTAPGKYVMCVSDIVFLTCNALKWKHKEKVRKLYTNPILN